MADIDKILKKYEVDPNSGKGPEPQRDSKPTIQERLDKLRNRAVTRTGKTAAARVNDILQKYGVDPSPVTPVRQRSGPSIYQQALEKLAATPRVEKAPTVQMSPWDTPLDPNIQRKMEAVPETIGTILREAREKDTSGMPLSPYDTPMDVEGAKQLPGRLWNMAKGAGKQYAGTV